MAQRVHPLVRAGALPALLSLVLGACAQAGPSATPAATGPTAAATPSGPTGKLVIGMNAEIESPHPYLAYQIVGISARLNMFDNLVDYDYEGKIVPALAQSWKVEGLTVTFTLRRGVKFHNGEDLTADAVRFSLEHLRSEELKAGGASNMAAVQEFKVIDPYTVQMVLSRIDSRIFDVLANNFSILPPKYVKDVGLAGFIAKPVGTGPFRFIEWAKDDHLTMEANEGYWEGSYKGKAGVKTLVFRPITNAATRVAELRSGGVDIIQDVPPDQVAPLRSAGFDVMESKSPAVQYIFFNTSNPAGAALKDPRVRLAMNYAVDTNTIIKTVLQGFGRPLPVVHDGIVGFNSQVAPIPFDPAKAKALLAEAGLSGGLDLELDISTSVKPDVAQAIVAQLAQVGIRVKLNTLPTAVYNDRWIKKQLSPLYFNTWNTFTDPALLDLLAGCKGSLSSFCSADAQKFLDEGGGTLDQAKRDPAYKQAVAVFAKDPFAIYVNQNSALTGVSKKVQGWKPHGVTYVIGTRVQVR